MNLALEKSFNTESELKNEINILQRNLMETTTCSQNNNEKLKQVCNWQYINKDYIGFTIPLQMVLHIKLQLQKQLSNTENERRVLAERLDSIQQSLSDLRHMNQNLQDQVARLQTELANNEVQRSGLEAQLRLTKWPQEGGADKDEDLMRQLQIVQREKSEMRGKLDALNDKV